MPWTEADVEGFIKGLSASQKKTWVEVANKALEACAGEDDCEAKAVKQANSVVGKLGESVSLADSLRAALKNYDERTAIPVGNIIEEANEPVEMSFVEQAGQLIPWEGK